MEDYSKKLAEYEAGADIFDSKCDCPSCKGKGRSLYGGKFKFVLLCHDCYGTGKVPLWKLEKLNKN